MQTNTPHTTQRRWAWGLTAAAALALAACGGSDDDEGAGPVGLAYSVGGSVTGLADGQSLVLQNNGTDDLTVKSNGDFTFDTRVAKGAGFDVQVKTQPSGQTCTVSSGKGEVDGKISDVKVSCVNNSTGGGGADGSVVTTAQWKEGTPGACVNYPAGTSSYASSTSGRNMRDDGSATIYGDKGALQYAAADCAGGYQYVLANEITHTVRARYTYEGISILRVTEVERNVSTGVTSSPSQAVWWMVGTDLLCSMGDDLAQTDAAIGDLVKNYASTTSCLVKN